MFIYAILVLLPALINANDHFDKLVDNLFGAYDFNSDGQITTGEYVQAFQNMDADQDVVLTKNEFKNVLYTLYPEFTASFKDS